MIQSIIFSKQNVTRNLNLYFLDLESRSRSKSISVSTVNNGTTTEPDLSPDHLSQMHPRNPRTCVCERGPCAASQRKECENWPEALASSCPSCEQTLGLLLNILQAQSSCIVQHPSSESTSILFSSAVQNLLRGNSSLTREVTDCSSTGPSFSRELGTLVSQIHQRNGDWCLMVQNGMAQQGGIVCSEQDDSGFGSGGPSFSSQQTNTERDLDILDKNHKQLIESCCYFGALDSARARKLLKHAPMGAFLIRDSSDSNYLYSVSVKTERGATSVRILYADGLFQFDSHERVRQRLPRFDSVMSLIDFHVMLSRDGKNKKWKWEDNSGNKMMTVVLDKPKKCTIPSLAHLSRIKINQCLKDVHVPEWSVDRLPVLPSKLRDYLKAYPYRL